MRQSSDDSDSRDRAPSPRPTTRLVSFGRAFRRVFAKAKGERPRNLILACGLVVVILGSWSAGIALTERLFPATAATPDPWPVRSQFGGMFGAVSSLLTALNLAFLIYALVAQARETRRQNEIAKWQANYSYLLDAKKLITDHPEVLELHGLRLKDFDATPAQIAYVVIDLKAADLYYRIDGSDPVKLTEYRDRLLKTPKYCDIARMCVETGTLLPSSPFRDALRTRLASPEPSDQRRNENALTGLC